MLQAFCFIFIMWVVAVTAISKSELQISLTTLKSDLNLILEDFSSPRTVNIQYAEGAILHAVVLPKSQSAGGRYIKIDGLINIKQKKKPSEVRSALIYEDGSFGIPLNEEDTTHIIITPNPGAPIEPADKTLTYVPLTQLTNALNTAIGNIERTKFAFPFTWPNLPLGTAFTKLVYYPAYGRLFLSQPLKGVSLQKGDKLNVNFNFNDLVRPETYKSIKGLGDKIGANFKELTKPGGLKSVKNMLKSPKPKSDLLNGVSQIVAKKRPDVFFDVWYEPRGKQYGSSSGSLAGVDAVRVYEEWERDLLLLDLSMGEKVGASRAEYIRERTFEQDMYTAYIKLQSPVQAPQNAIINYADEIVLDVRPGSSDLGDRRFISAAGTSSADEAGSGPLNVKAFYALNQLQYTSLAPEGYFVPASYEQQSWYLKYTDWGMFERHLKAIWTAMQGGCSTFGRLTYDFSIFYGEGIPVKYDCRTRTIELQDTISVLTDVPPSPNAIRRCNALKYLPSQQVELKCLENGVLPIAIRQEPVNLWSKYGEPVSINTAVLSDDMIALQESLIKTGKSRQKTPQQGAIILDEKLLLDMKLPHGKNNLGYVETYSYFTGSDLQMLKFHGDYFSTETGLVVPLTNIFASTNYEGIELNVAKDYVIGAKYLTIKKLQQDLKKMSEEALKRCVSRKTKSFMFKFVHQHKFALCGFYDCSNRVFRFEGDFKALTNTYGNTQIRSSRIIDGFIYVEEDNFFITGGQSFDDVYAFSVPEMTILQANTKSYGAPIEIDEQTFVVFKSKDVS